MARLRDPALRLAYRAGYWAVRAWWLVSRPTKRGVKCVLTRGDEVLLVRHTYGDSGRWTLPGGGVKRREEPLAAARREIREELGVDVDDWRLLGELFERIAGKNDRLWCFASEIGGRSVQIDAAEIAEARWFAPDKLPPRTMKYVERIIALRPAPTAAPRQRQPRARG